jgi:hypothetical protein
VLRLKDPEHKRTLLEETQLSGRAVFGIRVSKTVPNVTVDLNMLFDTKSGRLVKQENVGDGTATSFGDYKEFHAVPVAQRLTVLSKAGDTVVDRRLLEFRAEESSSPQLFRGP